QHDIYVVGCSSSEAGGARMGTASDEALAAEIFRAVYPVLKERDIFLGAQCCEHLNRAIIVEEACAKLYGLEQVNVVPVPKAGGSFATAAYKQFARPVAVETISARAGMDIGGVLIGMHIRHVAVPLKLTRRTIGQAHVTAARSRPKFIGGQRTNYDENLM
ncbi:MAG: TIGR01440 family protein, partial [Clostridiales bacterium]|nr:TIGR01440 family protein [Clostridiales bacterium]